MVLLHSLVLARRCLSAYRPTESPYMRRSRRASSVRTGVIMYACVIMFLLFYSAESAPTAHVCRLWYKQHPRGGGGSIRRIDARFIAAAFVGCVEKRSNLIAFSPPQTYLSVTRDVIPTRLLLCFRRLLLQHVCNGSTHFCICLYGRIRNTCAQDKNLCTRIQEPFSLP